MIIGLFGVSLVLGMLGFEVGLASDRPWSVWIVPGLVAVLFVLTKATDPFPSVLLFVLWGAAGFVGTKLGLRQRVPISR